MTGGGRHEGPGVGWLSGGRTVEREGTTICFTVDGMVVVFLNGLCERSAEIPKEVFSVVQSPWNFELLVIESSPKVVCHFWRPVHD
jgi:hypothetical protein